jgi:hypothetical protein
MKHAIEMGPGVMIYLPSFIKIDTAVQKLMKGIRSHTDSMVIA